MSSEHVVGNIQPQPTETTSLVEIVLEELARGPRTVDGLTTALLYRIPPELAVRARRKAAQYSRNYVRRRFGLTVPLGPKKVSYSFEVQVGTRKLLLRCLSSLVRRGTVLADGSRRARLYKLP